MNAPQARDYPTSPSVIDWAETSNTVFEKRLRAALQDAERRTHEVLRRKGNADPTGCLRCLSLALAEAHAGRHYVAWDNLHQFDIEYLATLEDNEEARRIASYELLAEANEKLQGWRHEAVERLSTAIDTKQQVPSVELLTRLRAQLATQAQNNWIKRDAVYNAAVNVLGLSLATIAFFLSTAELGWYDHLFGSAAKPMGAPLRLGVLAAFLGGVISVALSVEANDLPSKIPNLTLKLATLTWLRPTVGALCAIPVVFIAQSGLLKIGTLPEQSATILLCLVTGFSERWFFTAMQHVITRTKT